MRRAAWHIMLAVWKCDRFSDAWGLAFSYVLLPSFNFRSLGCLSVPWPNGGLPLPYGNVGLNQRSGKFRGFASWRVVMGFEDSAGFIFAVETFCDAIMGFVVRVKKERDRPTVEPVTRATLLEEGRRVMVRRSW